MASETADQWVLARVQEIEDRGGTDWLGRSPRLWAEAYAAVCEAEGPFGETEQLRAAACLRWLRRGRR